MLPTVMSRFIGTHLELSLFILNFFPAKGAMDLNIFFFHKSAVHQKCRTTKSVVISNTSFKIRSPQTVTNGQEIFVFIS